MSSDDRRVRAALIYAQRFGWPVFPTNGKVPLTSNGFKDATRNPEQIETWWREHPGANVAIPTGAISGFDVLDIDPRHGGDDSLDELLSSHGPLPDTIGSKTGGGGRHILFRHREGVRNTAGSLPGMDGRGDGGYVVVPPSQHESGNEYVWEVSSRPGEVELAECPDWLFEQLAEPPNGRPIPAPPIAEEIPKGKRNATLCSIAGTMQCRGISQGAIEAALLEENKKCNPPLSEEEVRNIARSVSRYPAEDAGPSEIEWPQLVSLENPHLPRLNLSCLPAWVGNYAAALATSTETPGELPAGLVLTTCAAAAARRLSVRVRTEYHEPCNLWLVVALPPGNRKSAVQSSAAAPLISWEQDIAAEVNPEILRVSSERETLVARAKALRSKAAKDEDRHLAEQDAKEAADIEASLPEVPNTPQLWTSDSTPERMGTLLADNDEHMAWLSSEGGIFDALGRYSPSGVPNLDLMLKAHSGDAERVDRGSRPPVYLKRPLLTVGLSPQPEVLRGLAAKPGFRGRGLIARFLYLLPPSPLGYRTLDGAPIPDGVHDAYSAGVRAMLDWKPAYDEHGEEQLHELRLSGDAYAEWLAFAQHVESGMKPGGDFEHVTDWAGKAPGAAARLAGVLHGIKYAHGTPWEVKISVETMTDALEIMAVIARHSQAAIEQRGAEESVAGACRVWQWVVQGRRDQFPVREAHQALKGTFQRVKDLNEALSVLEERGYIRAERIRTGKPGRPPSPSVRVRPDIVETWR